MKVEIKTSIDGILSAREDDKLPSCFCTCQRERRKKKKVSKYFLRSSSRLKEARTTEVNKHAQRLTRERKVKEEKEMEETGEKY